jgi:hypothetical protein
MRLRLAPLVAAAIIFAPGWHGQGPRQHPGGSDLAARVLAPTVDEGAIREGAEDVGHQLDGRQAKRWRPAVTFGAVTVSVLGAIAFVAFWVVASYVVPVLCLFRLRFRFSRAPPRLQPA